jgi:Ca2+-binding EF-hand superfamily protein
LPFFVVVSSVLAQAWLQPFAKANDNVLELATLTMLLCVLYGDVALNAEAMGVPETQGAGLSAIVTIGAALFIAVVLSLQRLEKLKTIREQLLEVNFQWLVHKMGASMGGGGETLDLGAGLEHQSSEVTLSSATTESVQRKVTGSTLQKKSTKALKYEDDIHEPSQRRRDGRRNAEDRGIDTSTVDRARGDSPSVRVGARRGAVVASEDLQNTLGTPAVADTETFDDLRSELEISDHELKRHKKLFALFDEDGGGTIDVHELANVFKALDVSITMITTQELFDSVDTDTSGQIDFGEFLRALVHRQRKAAAGLELEETFKTFLQTSGGRCSRHSMLAGGLDFDAALKINVEQLLGQLESSKTMMRAYATSAERREKLAVKMMRVAAEFETGAGDNHTSGVKASEDLFRASSAILTADNTTRRSVNLPSNEIHTQNIEAEEESNTDQGEFGNPLATEDESVVDESLLRISFAAFHSMMVDFAEPVGVRPDILVENEQDVGRHRKVDAVRKSATKASQLARAVRR